MRAARFTVEALERRVLLTALPSTVHASADAQYVISGDATSGYAVTLSAGTFSFDDSVGATGNVWANLNLTVSGSAVLALNTAQNFSSLTLSDSAKVIDQASDGGWQGTNHHYDQGNLLVTAGLTFTPDPTSGLPTATLDLGDNDMVLKGVGPSYVTQLRPMLRRSLQAGWSGPGLVSSAAAATIGTSVRTALGYGPNDNSIPGIHYSTFDGVPVGPTDFLIKYTLNGDTNLDAIVNNVDFTRFSNAWNAYHDPLPDGTYQDVQWGTGDFDYTARINNSDLTLLSNDFNQPLVGPSLQRTIVPTGKQFTVVEGQPVSNVVLATFTDTNTTTAASYDAWVSWGDGNLLPATVNPDSNPNDVGGFVVTASSPFPLNDANALIVAMVQYTAASGLQGRPGALGEPLLMGPAAPSGLTAKGVSTSEIDLAWTNNSTTATSVQVDRSTDGGMTYPLLRTLSSSATSYHDQGLLPGAHYYYKITAVDAGGLTAYSDSADAYTADTSNTSLGLTATAAAGAEIDLTWTAAIAGITALEVDRSTDGTSFSPVQSLPVNATTYSDTGLAPGGHYWYEVRYLHADGTWEFAGPADAFVTPSTPLNLIATPRGSHNVDLSWTGWSSNPDITNPYIAYDIYRTGPDGTMQVGTTTGIQFTDTTVQPGLTYSYYLKAHTGTSGQSAPSASVQVGQLPAAPSLTSATAVSPNEVDLVWADAMQGFQGFAVERSSGDSSAFSVVATLDSSATAFADKSVKDDADYTYQVLAFQNGHESDASNSRSVTTPLIAPSHFTATAFVGNSSAVNLSWSIDSSANTYYRPPSFVIERSGGFSGPISWTTPFYGYLDTNVLPGIQYTYQVRATDPNDSTRTSSLVEADVTPPPTVPDSYPTQSRINLAIDSNNQGDLLGGVLDPTIGDTAAREAIKNDPSLPGALLWPDGGFSGVANYVVNSDGTRNPRRPVWSWGYGLNPADTSGTTDGGGGTVIAIELPYSDNWNWDAASLTISYAASDPAAVSFTGTGTLSDPYVYTLPSGDTPLRLWSSPSYPYQIPDALSSQPFLAAFQGSSFDPHTSYYVAPGTYSGQALKALFGGNGFFTTKLGVEGVQPTHNTVDRTISVSLNPGDGTAQQSDQGLVTVGNIDLAIDSDNTSPPGDPQGANPDLPSRSISQQQTNSDVTKPGKILVVNDAETNGIPGFADGFTTDTISATANPAEHFVPLVLQVPDAVDVSQMLVNLDYNASDPRFVQRPTATEPTIGYAPAPGSIRIWTAAGDTLRDGRPIEDGGQFVSSFRSYPATSLGFTNSRRTVTLYIEAVAAGTGWIDTGLRYVDPLFYNPAFPSPQDYLTPEEDFVRYTTVQDTVMAYGDPANTLVGDASGSDGGDAATASFSGAVNLADGTVATPAVTDLASSGFGQPWGITRVWTNSAVSQLSPGVVGNGWVISEMPSLIQATSTIIANIDGRGTLYFDAIPAAGGSPATFKARFYSHDALAYDEANDEYTLTDTTGGKLTFYGFSTELPANQRGKLKLMTDAAGNPTTPYYNSLGQLDTVIRSDGTVTETWTYTYKTRDPNVSNAPDQLLSVSLSRSGGPAPGLVRTVNYTYYDAPVPNSPNNHGNKGDLKTVVVDDAAGNPLSTYYYRYAIYSAAQLGYLTVILGPSGYARYMAQPGTNLATLDAASDDGLRPYADIMLGYWDLYNPTPVFSQSIIGTGATNTYGNTADIYEYIYGHSGDPAVGTNVWTHSTMEGRLASGSNFINNEFYTNYAGEVMATSQTPLYSSQSWNTFTAYDPEGRITLQAMPSAVSNLDPQMPDLVGREPSGSYELLSADSGVINQTEYGSSTAGGTVDGYVSETAQLHGTQGLTDASADSDGTRVPISTTLYQTRSAGSATVYLVSSRTLYGTGNYGDPRTVGYNYLAWNNLQPAEVQTTPPATSEASSGSSQATAWFDQYGRVQWTQDALGYIDFTAYDNGTGAVTTSVIDLDPSSNPLGVAVPGDLSRSSMLPAPLALTTTTKVDNLGRPLYVEDPRGNRTNFSYVDKATSSEIDTLPPAGPLQVTYVNYAQGFADSMTFSGAHLSTPTILHGGTIESLTRNTLDNAGRVVYADRYFDLTNTGYSASNAFGVKDVNYYRTSYIYGFDGQLTSTTDDLGTFTQILHDALGRPTAKLLGGQAVKLGGTYYPVGGVTVETDVYDAGSVGDGNLTQVTQFPGPDSLGKALPNRVTTDYYDWRDRLVASDNTVRLTYDTLDNLGEVTDQSVYDRSTAGFPAFKGTDGFANGNPVPPPTASALRARTATLNDDQGRAYQSTQFGVDPNNGSAPSVGVTSNSSGTVYDAAGQVIATSSPTGLWTKTTYDGAGRVSATYSTDNAGNNASSFSGDHVFSQQAITYDADGDPTLTVTSDRLPAASSATGALGGTGGPTARVASVRNVYDPADRPTETDNFGTNPVTSDGSGALITRQAYDAAGQIGTTTDAAGVWTQYRRDYLGRVTSRWDGFVQGGAANSASDVNKVTGYGYNGDDEIKFVSVNDFIPAAGGTPSSHEPQQTTYDYGTTNSLDKSKLSVVHYPDKTSQSYVYDHLGETVQLSQQDGTQHHYSFDSAGRQTLDYVDHIAAGVDSTVMALATEYDVLDRPVTMSSDSGGPGAFTIVNQVKDVYDPFGNLAAQYQQGNGAVAAGTPGVQYGYDPSNPTRLLNMVYPDGRVEWYGYSGLDAAIGRVSFVSDPNNTGGSGHTIEQYNYLGLDSLVGKMRPQGQAVTETVTPDTYGRVGSVQWSQGSTVTDSFTYGYDGVGDVTSSQNNVNSLANETYGYDNLHRQTSFTRGAVNGQIPAINDTWQTDSQGNKFGGNKYGNGYAGNDHKDASHNQNGDQLSLSFTNGPAVTFVYDAWGRVVLARSNPNVNSPLSTFFGYAYDALGRNISQSSHLFGETGGVALHLFYDGQNVIEERDGSNAVTAQYVRSPVDGAVILRDSQTSPSSPGTSSDIPQVSGAPLNQRLYAQDNGQGSVTSITFVGGAVQERYLFDQDGQVQILKANPANSFNWVYLYHGGRYAQLWQDPTTSANALLGGGFYTFNAGSSWLDAFHGVSIQPDYGAYASGQNPYDSNIGVYSGSWFSKSYLDATDAARPALKVAAFVGSFTPAAPVAIPLSIALNGTDTYASGATWGQIGRQVGIEAGITLATFGLIKGAGYVPGLVSDSLFTARVAGRAFMQAGDEGAQGLLMLLSRGGMPPAAGALAGGGEMALAGDTAAAMESAGDVVAGGGWSGPYAGLGAGFANSIYSLTYSFNAAHNLAPSPRPIGPDGGQMQSHHGLQAQWAEENLAQYGYRKSLAPTINIETGVGQPHTIISVLQNARRDARLVAGLGKWSSTLDEELGYIVSDFRAAQFGDDVIHNVLQQQYAMLDRLNIPYTRVSGF